MASVLVLSINRVSLPIQEQQLVLDLETSALRTTTVIGPQFENNHLAEMSGGSEEGSYLRLKDSVYHSTLGLRGIVKKKTVLVISGESH